jgi:hypothetical protein
MTHTRISQIVCPFHNYAHTNKIIVINNCNVIMIARTGFHQRKYFIIVVVFETSAKNKSLQE